MNEAAVQLSQLVDQVRPLIERAVEIWRSGGWAMVGIGAIGLLMFGLGGSVWLRLHSKKFQSIREQTWRRWIEHPSERRGPVGELMNFVLDRNDITELSTAFQELQKSEIAPFSRDLRVMRICVSAAPLVGLLGTVTGMLATFDALATGAGGDKTMGLIADGISTALVTTETGLVVALPGLFFQYQLTQKYERYRAFLTHLENVCIQWSYHRTEDRAQAA